MKEFKIEKGTHYISSTDKFIVVAYMPSQDKFMNISFYNEANSKKTSELHVGVWRLKNVRCECNKTNPILGYENQIIGDECVECGKTYMINKLYELDSINNNHFKTNR